MGYIAAFTRVGGALLPSVVPVLNPLVILALAIGAGSVLLPASWVTGVRLEDARPRLNRFLRLGYAWVLLPASVVLVVASGFSPFLYFQF